MSKYTTLNGGVYLEWINIAKLDKSYKKASKTKYLLYDLHKNRTDTPLNLLTVTKLFTIEMREAVDFVEKNDGYIYPANGDILFENKENAYEFGLLINQRINSLKTNRRIRYERYVYKK